MSTNLQQNLSDVHLSSLPAARPIVQIEAATLSSLLSSIESLPKDVTTLQSKLTTISSELLTLQTKTGFAFLRFPKLPIEIRVIIWRLALTSIPQIHVIRQGYISESKIHDVAMSCKEALSEFKALQLDYFEMPHFETSQKVCNYVNLNIDIFWLNLWMTASHRPFEFHSGKCTIDPTIHCGRTDCVLVEGYFHYFPIRTMAISVESWENPYRSRVTGYDGSLATLLYCKVEELLLVLGDMPISHDVVFSKPSMKKTVKLKILGVTPGLSWSELEEEIMKAMQNFIDNRSEERRIKCLELGIALEDLEAQYTRHDLGDYSGWKVPKVRFVQAKPGNARQTLSFPA